MGDTMLQVTEILKTGLKQVGVASILAVTSLAAHAAECFDRQTDDPKAGDATAVVGPSVGVLRASTDGFLRPDAGDDLFTGDRVRTGADSHLQLKLCDWSTYTFSPDSESDISEFFDEDGVGRRRVINFLRGGFRLASGRDTEPGSTEVEIQESGVTMGVRGTNVILVELDGVVYALLEGPARENSGLSPQGLVDFWEGNSEAIISRLKRPGYAVRIDADGVSSPFRADRELLQRIYGAFVALNQETDGELTDGAGDPLDNSGQGGQEGVFFQQVVVKEGNQKNENTENNPEQPVLNGITLEELADLAFPINIGDILPLDALEEFAAAQLNPDGHLLALAPAQLFIDTGAGPSLANQGVVLIQLHIDWANRTLAPEALASFVKLDFSVSDPNDLTIANPLDVVLSDEIDQAYIQAVLASANLPFMNGVNGLAVFEAPLFTFTIKKGANDSVTVDVGVNFNATDNQGVQVNVVSDFTNLTLAPGMGDLAFFDFDLGDVASVAELDSFVIPGVTVLSEVSDVVISTLGAPTPLNGISFGQLEVNFDNRTVGGGGSFLAITAAADPAIGGMTTTQFVAFDQAVSFDNGLFNLAFFPLASLTSDPALLKGQALIGLESGALDGLEGDIAAIVSDDSGNHLFTEIEIDDENLGFGLPIATIADLEAQAAIFEAQAAPRQGVLVFHFDGTFSGGDLFVSAKLETANNQLPIFTGTASASIDINFTNRSIGGGDSFVSVDIPGSGSPIPLLNFIESLNVVSFNDAVKGVGVFGFDSGDFSGNNIDSALFLIRSGPDFGATRADLFFNFNDGAGGAGFGEVSGMPIREGPTLISLP